MQRLPSRFSRVMGRLWLVLLFAAGALLALNAYFIVRPTWPVGTIVVDSQSPIVSPLSETPVCGYHLCVEHLSGSTCLDRTLADSLVATAPDGEMRGALKVRFSAPPPEYSTVEGAVETSQAGEYLVDSDSRRVAERCAVGSCIWTEHLVMCGDEHEVRYDVGRETIYVERARRGLELVTGAWILGTAAALLMMVAFLLRFVAGRLFKREGRD